MRIYKFNEEKEADWGQTIYSPEVYEKWAEKIKRQFGLTKSSKILYDYEYIENVDDQSTATLLTSDVDFMFYFENYLTLDSFDKINKFFQYIYKCDFNPRVFGGWHDSMDRKNEDPKMCIFFTVPLYEIIPRLKVLKTSSQFDL